MQREEKALILLVSTVVFLFIGTIGLSVVQCSSAAAVAQRHESEIISKCQLVNNSLYVDCLKREWDRIHEEESG